MMLKKFIAVAALGMIILFPVSARAFTLVEAYNVADTWSDGTYYATQVALMYVPTVSYNLSRVEFFTGRTKSNVTIALRGDNSGYPGTAILAAGTYDNSGGDEGSWQGATFASPYSVLAGTPYWITWYNTAGLDAPYSDGIIRTVRWSDSGNIDDYSNLYQGRGFKTKFYEGEGDNAVPEPATMSLLGLGLLGLTGLKRRRE